MGIPPIKDAQRELNTMKEMKALLPSKTTILRNHAAMPLSVEGQLQLVKLLQAQAEPAEAMKDFRKQPRLKVRSA